MTKKIIQASGKRKRAIARATLKEGKGVIKINNKSLSVYEPALYKARIQEPLILSGETAHKVDISVTVRGGGINSQSDAARLSIAKAMAEYKPSLKEIFLAYDRQLLVADVRRKEMSKPNRHGQARAKRQKSYR